ncbi:MAG TPA: diacylglycerol kinase family protein, partial [Aquihabitans sp.]|nr:diacylglycerol kinase family protein [Aquihabitans sp.]
VGELDEERTRIVDAFAAQGHDAEVHAAAPADLPEVVRRCWAADPHPRAVVVAGGDGTVSCAAGAAAGTDVVLGVLPLGTFNHFAKDLGMPTDLAEAAAALAAAEVGRVDVGEVNGRVFVNNSVLGLYPDLVAIRDELRDRHGWGKVRAVPVAALHVLRRFPVRRLDLHGPGYRRDRVRTPLLFVGNGVFEADGAGTPARAAMADGVLGVAVSRAVSRLGLLRSLVRGLARGSEAVDDVEEVAVRELEVRLHARRVRVALDGEVDELAVPLRYRVRPGALQVLVPPPELRS